MLDLVLTELIDSVAYISTLDCPISTDHYLISFSIVVKVSDLKF